MINTLIAMSLLANGPGTEKIDDVVSAHDSALSLIKRFDMVVTVRQVSQNGEPIDPPTELGRFRWSRDGERERTQIEYSPATVITQGNSARSKPMTPPRYDLYTDGKNDHVLRNWDPKNPKKITPWDRHGVSAMMGPAVPGRYNTLYALGSLFSLTQVAAHTHDQQRTLRQFVRDSPQVRCETVEHYGVPVPRLIMTHPDTRTGGKFRNVVIAVTMDPETFMITEMEVTLPESALGTASRQVLHVDKFRKFDGGATIPEKVTVTSHFDGGSAVTEIAMVPGSATVNKELPPDALDFRFPEGALVRDMSTMEGGKVTAHVWGSDNRPSRSVRDIQELGPPPSDAEGQEARRRWLTYAIYGVGGPLILALAAYLIWRRWR